MIISSTPDGSSPGILLPCAEEVQRYFKQELGRTADQVQSLSVQLTAAVEGAKQRRLQLLALARAAKIAPTWVPFFLKRALQVQGYRAELTRSLQVVAKRLLAGNSVALSSTHVQRSGSAGHSSPSCHNARAVLHLIDKLWEAEAPLTAAQRPVCPSKTVFRAFMHTAVLERRLHARLHAQLARRDTAPAAVASPASSEGPSASGGEEEEDALTEALRLLSDMTAGSQDARHARRPGGTARSSPLAAAAAPTAAPVSLNEEAAVGPERPTVFLRLPYLVSIAAYCGDAPWAETHAVEPRPGSPTAPTVNGATRSGTGAGAPRSHSSGGEAVGPSSSYGLWLPAPMTAAPVGLSPTTSATPPDTFHRSSSSGGLPRSPVVTEEEATELMADGKMGGCAERVTLHVSEAVERLWDPLLTDHLVDDLLREGDRIEDEEAAEAQIRTFVDALRVALIVDVSATVLALQMATEMLFESEDKMVFDGFRQTRMSVQLPAAAAPLTEAAVMRKTQRDEASVDEEDTQLHHSTAPSPPPPHGVPSLGPDHANATVPMRLWNLPGMTKVFYAMAFTLGAAVLVDYRAAVGATTTTTVRTEEVVDVDQSEGDTPDRALVDADNEDAAQAKWLAEWAALAGLRRPAAVPYAGTPPLGSSCGNVHPLAAAQRLWSYFAEHVFAVESTSRPSAAEAMGPSRNATAATTPPAIVPPVVLEEWWAVVSECTVRYALRDACLWSGGGLEGRFLSRTGVVEHEVYGYPSAAAGEAQQRVARELFRQCRRLDHA